jgi:transketolase
MGVAHLKQVDGLLPVADPAVAIPEQLGSIRAGFGQGLLAAGEQNSKVMALCADVTESIRMHHFADKFPDRFLQVGVAEQNLVGVAAGLALGGLRPFAGSYAVFSPGRSWDQLRVSVCYSNLPVVIVGGHAGLTVGPDGATHQALEDIALTRVLPNLTVIVPADELEAQRATLALANIAGPAYLRLGRDTSVKITSETTPFEIGHATTLREGRDVTIVACGIMVAQARWAGELLAQEGIQATIINCHTVKPLDKSTLVAAAQHTKAVVTAEEHQIAGGLGSAVAELLSEHYPVPIVRVGVKDTFGESGQSQELLKKYGLTSGDIVKAVWKVLEIKKA